MGDLFNGPQIILIAFVLLLLFGGKNIPELMRGFTQSVTTTPSINPSVTKRIRWYNSTLFKSIVYPLIVGLILWIISILVKKSP